MFRILSYKLQVNGNINPNKRPSFGGSMPWNDPTVNCQIISKTRRLFIWLSLRYNHKQMAGVMYDYLYVKIKKSPSSPQTPHAHVICIYMLIYLLIYQSIYMFIDLSIYLSIYLLYLYIYIYTYILYVIIYIYLYSYLSIYRSIYLFI